jgi:predicted nucleic acid-binding protein
VASLVDTNILVYRCDPIDPAKSAQASHLLREGLVAKELYLPHQALIEFVNAVTKTRAGGRSLLSPEETWRQAEDLLNEFPVLYPTEKVFRIAMLGMAAYKFSWYDAHMWAYAEHYGLPELLSEDFEHGRRYGSVRVRNPFLMAGLG